MELYRTLQNTKLTGMEQELSDEIWDLFHKGEINDQDDFYTLFHEWIDNQVIYYSDCEAILENNSDYHYNEHELWGRPENICEAAYACLYDYIMDNPDVVTFDELEKELNKTEKV